MKVLTALNWNKSPSEINWIASKQSGRYERFSYTMIISLKCYGYLMLTFLAGKEVNWKMNTANPEANEQTKNKLITWHLVSNPTERGWVVLFRVSLRNIQIKREASKVKQPKSSYQVYWRENTTGEHWIRKRNWWYRCFGNVRFPLDPVIRLKRTKSRLNIDILKRLYNYVEF